jgi:hypothetical protein
MGNDLQAAVQPRKEMVKLIVSKVAYVSIVIGLPLWLTNFSWWQVLIGFAVIHLTAGMIRYLAGILVQVKIRIFNFNRVEII